MRRARAVLPGPAQTRTTHTVRISLLLPQGPRLPQDCTGPLSAARAAMAGPMRPLEWHVREAPRRVRGLRHTGRPPREAGPLHPAEGLNTARGSVRENMSLSDRPAGTSALSCISDSDSDWDSLRPSGRISRRPTALLGLLSLPNSLDQSLLSTPCWFCVSGEARWYSCRAPLGLSGLRQFLRFSWFHDLDSFEEAWLGIL